MDETTRPTPEAALAAWEAWEPFAEYFEEIAEDAIRDFQRMLKEQIEATVRLRYGRRPRAGEDMTLWTLVGRSYGYTPSVVTVAAGTVVWQDYDGQGAFLPFDAILDETARLAHAQKLVADAEVQRAAESERVNRDRYARDIKELRRLAAMYPDEVKK